MRRDRRHNRLAALAAGAASITAFAIGASPAQAAIPAAPFGEFYGVSPATELSAGEFAQLGRGRAGVVRLPFYWPSIEPNAPVAPEEGPLPLPINPQPPESKQFKSLDQRVIRAAENGIRVLPFVYGTPDWVASDPKRPPLDSDAARSAWQDLLADLVGRYGPAGTLWSENPEVPKRPITDWQISNEPNSALFWAPAPSPAEYADLLKLSSAAIKQADPGAAIVLAGMFGTPASGIHAWDFLEALYGVPGIADTFDAYALHPYSPNLNGIELQIDFARDVVRRHGDAKLPLLITEIGWPTDGPAGYNLVKTPDGQKRLLSKSFRLFLKERRRWNIERVIWYTWRDNDVQTGCSVCQFSGLFTDTQEPKPAWRKFTQFTGGQP